ncbi:MAG: hypothetical protein WDN46_22940 [Methylocella sp.]
MIDQGSFFDHVRAAPFDGRLNHLQVDGMTRILGEWSRRDLTDQRWLAYMLATVFHETGTAMQPVQEAGSQAYLRSKPYYPYIGEGLVGVTWKSNYAKFGAKNPGDLLQWPLALRGLYDGMINGMYTGARLSTYFSSMHADWINARRIINGEDKNVLIAGYGHSFFTAIGAASGAAK